jgi:hypothetical protein
MPELRFVRRFAAIFDLGPLVVSGVAAFILVVAAFGFSTGMVFAYLLVAWVCWVLANHFVEIVEHRAHGQAGWPTFSLDTIAAARSQLGLVLLALGAVVLAVRWWLLARGNTAAAAVLAAVAVFCLPAIAALLAVTRSIPRALDPRGVGRAVAGLGLDYALCFGLALGAGALGSLAFARRGALELLGAVYAVLALAFVIGTVVYHRRLTLGVHAPRSPEARLEAELRRLATVRRAALDHAYGIASGGNAARGLAYLASYAATESDPLAARLWMFYEVARWEDARPALELGTALAAELNAAGRADEAAKVLVTCRFVEDRADKGRVRDRVPPR